MKAGSSQDDHLIFPDFLGRPVDEAARMLLGCLIIRDYESEGEQARVRIVETEAYDQNDPASHAYHGRSARNDALFGPSGHMYVYFTYGMHYCMNISCQEDGFGAGVLIRACQPVQGLDLLRSHRHGHHPDRELTNGPAKLCQALDIDKRNYGHDLRNRPSAWQPPVWTRTRPSRQPPELAYPTPRRPYGGSSSPATPTCRDD